MHSIRKTGRKFLCSTLSLAILTNFCNVLPVHAFAEGESGTVQENNNESGHRYQLFDESKSWTDAEAYCESLGGHLVTITSADEQDYIINELLPMGTQMTYFIGLSRDTSTNDWNWVTGEEFDYANWDEGEPNSTDENYVHMYSGMGNVGTWNNTYNYETGFGSYATAYCGFICEWEAEDSPISVENKMKHYALYSASDTVDLGLYGWGSSVNGNVYTGASFQCSGSEMSINGRVDAVGSVNAYGWHIEIEEQNENVEPVGIIDYDNLMHNNAQPYDYYPESPAYIEDRSIISKSVKTSGDVVISGTTFEGDCYIIADGDITYNVDSFETSGRVFLYSRNGNVIIKGTSISINGGIYAPHGKVSISSSETVLTGFIWADSISHSGSRLTVNGSNFDMLEPRSAVKTYTVDDDFREGNFNGLGISVSDELTLDAFNGEASPSGVSEYLGTESEKGVKVTYSSDKSFVSGIGDNVNLKYDLSGYGEASDDHEPVDLVIVVDNSGSMEGDRIEKTTASCKQIISRMRSNDRCAVVSFSDCVDVLQDLTSDKELLNSSLNRFYTDGGTFLYLGLKQALDIFRDQSDPEHKKYIILLSDGDSFNEHLAINYAAEAGQKNIRIFSLKVGNNTLAMQKMAINSNGVYKNTPDNDDIIKIMSSFASEVFSIAGRNTVFRTTVRDAASVDISAITPVPSEVTENTDGSVSLEWSIGRISLNAQKEISIPVTITSDTDGFADILENTSCVYYDSSGKASVIYTDDISIPVSEYTETGNWTVVFDSEQEDVDWDNIYWNGKRYGDGEISVYVSASDDGENFSEPVKADNNVSFSGIHGRYAKISVDMTVSSNGRSPELYDITIVSKDAVSEQLTNTAPTATIISKDRTKVNIPLRMRASVTDDCMDSDITVTWSCDDENVSFSDTSGAFTSVISSVNGSYDITCTVSDGVNTYQCVKTIVCEPADSYTDIGPEQQQTPEAPSINVMLPQFADRGEKISSKIELLNNADISWYSAILDDTEAADVASDGRFTLTMPETDGVYNVVVRAYDWSGRSDVKSFSITVDGEAAAVNIMPSANEAPVNTQAYFKVSVAGADKVQELSYTLNGKSVTIPENGILPVDTAVEKEFILEAHGITTRGKELKASAKINVVAPDTEKPVVSISFDKDDYIEGDNAVITVTASDNTGVKALTVFLNGIEIQPESSGKYIINDLRYGDYIITANAYDEAGNMGTVTEKITARDVITPAVGLEVDKTVVVIGESVNIKVTATDNSGTVSTELTVNDTSLPLSEDGTAVFSPVSAGSYVIKAIAVDPSGNTREAELKIEAVDPDIIAPDINIVLDKDTYFENDDISFTVEATDNIAVTKTEVFIDGEVITLFAGNAYIIKKAELRAYKITARAYDAEGNNCELTVTVNVNQEQAPDISITFDKNEYKEGDFLKGLVKVQGQTEIVTVTATVNNKPLLIENDMFELTDLKAGDYIFTFTAEDARGLTSTTSKTISVTSNEHDPDEKLYAFIDGLVLYGDSVLYKVIASDDIDKTTINVALNGEKITLSDELTYMFHGDKLFENEFVLTAKTNDGELLTVINTVLVHETDKPTVDVSLNKENGIQEDEDIIVTISAEDISGIRRIMTVFDGNEIPVDENGQVILGKLDMSTHTLVIRVWDNFENLRTYILAFYVVEDEGSGESSISIGGSDDIDPEELTARIISPVENGKVSCPTFIIGSAGGTDFNKYILDYQSADGGAYTLIKESNTSVNGHSLGEFDTTMLRNGIYKLRLRVYGSNDIIIKAEVFVSVEGQMKIGNFSLDFEDMNVRTGGIPLSLVRSYDSRDRNISGDFGYGWNQSAKNVSINTNGPLYTDWQKIGMTGDQGVQALRDHIVTVNWNNGRVEKFRMNAEIRKDGYGKHIIPFFEAIDGAKSKLTTPDANGFWSCLDNMIYNEDEAVEFDPMDWILTTADGVKYDLNKTYGVHSITDNSGNSITFDENGISGSNKALTIERDNEGHITSIKTSDGKTVSYEYDENGDLVKVTDISGNTTSFEYDDHYLTAVINSDNVIVSRNIYDDSGRLIKTIDAYDHEIIYDHDIEGREETITDRNGGVTRYVYDKNGNIVLSTDPMGNTVKNTYDGNGHLATKTDAMGNITRYIYDETGNLCELTDAEGNIVTNEYNTKGQVTSVNAMGIDILKVNYDEKGNTASTEDALGNTVNYSYDQKGKLTSVTDVIGTYMIISYDSNGNAISVTDGANQTAEFEYDGNGNCISKTLKYTSEGVERTITERYMYDDDNNLVQIIDVNGSITSAEYNSMGKIALTTDEKGRQTSYKYDDLGNLIKIVYADSTSESFTYDNEGNNLTATDRLGRMVKMEYDKVGNLLSKTYPNGAVVRYNYNKNYELISTVSASGSETKYEYDRIGRNTAIIDALDHRTEFTYNSHSQLESMTDAKGNTYTYTYDDNGNRISTEFPDHSTVSASYDARGRVKSRTDQHGYTTTYTYDGADRLTAVTDVLGNTTSYTYDEVGNLIKVTDANDHSTIYTYDDLGRVIRTTNVLGKTAEASYDVCGNILTSTDFGGKLTTYTYDDYDRLISKETADGTVEFSYTADGKLLSATDGSGTTYYTYDEMDGLKKVVYPDGNYVSYEYDDSGRLTNISTALGSTSYEYDQLDRLVKVIDRNGYATLYEYDANGNRSAVKYANGIVVSYNYDELNRLISEKALDKQGGLVAKYEYTLGASGERLKAEETDRTVEYTYDKLYRLTGEKITVGDEVTEYTYAYDSVSNRIMKTRNSAETTYTYNALNQLTSENGTSYQYDNAGNLISVTSDTKSVLYAYNAENKMIRATVQEGNSISVEEYEYDYAGNRTVKKSENDYTYYLNDVSGSLTQVIAELDANGNEKCWYTIGADLISQERSGTVSTYLYDGHGSVRGLFDETGAVTDTYNYDAWGELLDKTGTTENSFLYCGEQLDSATGLYYLRARYMNPSTGTFTTMDTYQGSIFDPVSLHKYLYANANPVMNSDPSGYNTLPDLEAGEAGEVPLEEASSISSKFAHTVWRSVITGTVFGGLDAYRQWRTTGKIDWGHVFDTFVITSAASVFFGVSYILGSAMQSTMILTALGGSSVIFAGAGLAQAVADGRAGKFDLVLIDLVFVGAAVKGAKSCYDSTVKIASAKNTAETVTVPTPENSNTAKSRFSNKDTFLPEEYYKQFKIQAEWSKNGVKHYYYQKPNTTRITYRLDPRSHSWERSVTVSDNYGRIKYRIDFGNHGMPESHPDIHIHNYEINTSGTSYSENGVLMFHSDNSAYINNDPPAKPWH
ncbi:VWA domain-containing protein [Ruminococcus flavefaciens]|uniref:VWA domain-containing protein n=1 Tax=Ruminococcus flavefaciens TaxID=1265 RepID=UPI0002FEF1AA|nr:VWA domain-containing protein [Ruminococcus flavefaciens]